MNQLTDLQQLYILADETREHFRLYNLDKDMEVHERRETAIATNLSALTASIQHMIDMEINP